MLVLTNWTLFFFLILVFFLSFIFVICLGVIDPPHVEYSKPEYICRSSLLHIYTANTSWSGVIPRYLDFVNLYSHHFTTSPHHPFFSSVSTVYLYNRDPRKRQHPVASYPERWKWKIGKPRRIGNHSLSYSRTIRRNSKPHGAPQTTSRTAGDTRQTL